MKTQLIRALFNGAKGAAIGAANTVPGVSGGTIAVITGIYDDLIAAVGRLFSREWRRHLSFLLPVLAGIVVGAVLFAGFIEFGLERYPEQTAFLFIGLILGSVPVVSAQVRGERARPVHIVAALAASALLVAQALMGEPGFREPIGAVSGATVAPLLMAGVIAAATMVVPGVSGGFVLVLSGMYTTVLQAVTTRNVPMLLVLAVGAAIGIILVARLMDMLLRRARTITYWIILGLVVGSVAGVWPGVASVRSAAFDVLAVAVGAAAALLLGKRTPRREAPPGDRSRTSPGDGV